MSRDGVADAASVFVESHVPSVVQAVLYTPMSANELCKPVFVSFFGQQAGDAVCDFGALRTVRQRDFALHGKDLGGVREVDLFGFNGTCNQAA